MRDAMAAVGSGSLALKVNLSAAGALRFRQLVPSSGAQPPSFARRPLSGSSGYAPPARPAPSALPAAVGAVSARSGPRRTPRPGATDTAPDRPHPAQRSSVSWPCTLLGTLRLAPGLHVP